LEFLEPIIGVLLGEIFFEIENKNTTAYLHHILQIFMLINIPKKNTMKQGMWN